MNTIPSPALHPFQGPRLLRPTGVPDAALTGPRSAALGARSLASSLCLVSSGLGAFVSFGAAYVAYNMKLEATPKARRKTLTGFTPPTILLGLFGMVNLGILVYEIAP